MGERLTATVAALMLVVAHGCAAANRAALTHADAPRVGERTGRIIVSDELRARVEIGDPITDASGMLRVPVRLREKQGVCVIESRMMWIAPDGASTVAAAVLTPLYPGRQGFVTGRAAMPGSVGWVLDVRAAQAEDTPETDAGDGF